LGKFFGDALSRDTLIAFMGPDKTGKSFWLLDLAFRGVKSRRRVALFEVGDLLQDEVLLRLGTRAAWMPLYPTTVKIPRKMDLEAMVVAEYESVDYKEQLEAGEAYKAFRRVCRERDIFRLSCHSNGTINVDGIRSILCDWQREGWEADVVVVDYADILAPPKGFRETLDQTDETWKQLRRLSQDLHCLVITASQSSALAYSGTATLGRKHFSGRKTKLAHVNGMVGINYNDGDRDAGVMRLNWVVRRNSDYRENRVVTVAGCLALACPAILSVF
jgi:hypothetical protein